MEVFLKETDGIITGKAVKCIERNFEETRKVKKKVMN